jgi:hypothetical protein
MQSDAEAILHNACNESLTTRGNALHPDDRAHVLRAYVYRGTHEAERANPGIHAHTGSRLPLITDAEWLAATDFFTKPDGRLVAKACYCRTHHSEIPALKEIIDAWVATKTDRRGNAMTP